MVGLKFISRKLRKGLDKSPDLWYNKYIKRKEVMNNEEESY